MNNRPTPPNNVAGPSPSAKWWGLALFIGVLLLAGFPQLQERLGNASEVEAQNKAATYVEWMETHSKEVKRVAQEIQAIDGPFRKDRFEYEWEYKQLTDEMQVLVKEGKRKVRPTDEGLYHIHVVYMDAMDGFGEHASLMPRAFLDGRTHQLENADAFFSIGLSSLSSSEEGLKMWKENQ